MTKYRVLVTGAAGAIGKAVCKELLSRGHAVRGFDCLPMPELQDAVVGDLADRQAVDKACAGMDSMVHLAAYPNDAPFMEVLLGPNVIGLFNVMDSARQNKMRRVVLASSGQVISGLKNRRQLGRPITVEDGVAPNNHYALTKVWLEQTAEMYVRCYEMSAIAVRIGWTPRDTRQADHIHRSEWSRLIYLSHRDAGRFFAQAVEAEPITFAILFAVSSAGAGKSVDMETARQLIGFEPMDTWPEGLAFDWTLPPEQLDDAPKS